MPGDVPLLFEAGCGLEVVLAEGTVCRDQDDEGKTELEELKPEDDGKAVQV